MEITHTKSGLIVLSSAVCVLALMGSQAHAQDTLAISTDTPAAKITVQAKTAVSNNPKLLRYAYPTLNVVRADEPLPDVIVPLNTDIAITDTAEVELGDDVSYETDNRFTDFDLVEGSPIFIGANDASEFDTLEATQSRAAYSEPTIIIEPLYAVAGAGLKTKF